MPSCSWRATEWRQRAAHAEPLHRSGQDGEVTQAAKTCTEASDGRYVISYQKLPREADGQREQMVRRLAARDSSMDILGLDVTWASEFAEAGWIREWTGANRAKVEEGTLEAPLRTAIYKGKLYAAPFNSNTQLLWYRSDLVPTPPKTWDEMIDMAGALAKQDKPHLIEIQGAPYEGATVWFHTLPESAGGHLLTADAKEPSLGQPAVRALRIMRRLATSVGADPSLSVQREGQNAAMMERGKAAFQGGSPGARRRRRRRRLSGRTHRLPGRLGADPNRPGRRRHQARGQPVCRTPIRATSGTTTSSPPKAWPSTPSATYTSPPPANTGSSGSAPAERSPPWPGRGE